MIWRLVTGLLLAVVLVAGEENKIANQCAACKTSLTTLQDKAVQIFNSANYKKAQSQDTRVSLLEPALNLACDEFKGWATVGADKDLKYMQFKGTIGGGMTLTNLSMGPHVDEQLKKACKALLASSDQYIVDELLKVKRVFDADLSNVCNAACGILDDPDDRVEL